MTDSNVIHLVVPDGFEMYDLKIHLKPCKIRPHCVPRQCKLCAEEPRLTDKDICFQCHFDIVNSNPSPLGDYEVQT